MKNPDTKTEHDLKDELYRLLREDAKILDLLEAASVDGLWYWDLENPHEEWLSPRFKKILGYGDEDMPAKGGWWEHSIFPEDLEAAVENLEKHCSHPENPYDQVVRYRHKDGSAIWVRCHGVAIRDEAGKPVRMLGTHTNITRLKERERKIEELNVKLRVRAEEAEAKAAELTRSNQDLDDFAYVASHDLKAPLRNIASLADWITKDSGHLLPETSSRHLDLLRERVLRMERLLEDLLKYSRAGRDEGQAEEIDTGELVSDVLELLSPPLGVEVRAISGLPVLSTARAPLQQCFHNLIDNAIKHRRRESGGRIELSCDDAGLFVRFSVRDDGPGIAPEFHDRVFDLFQSLQSHDEVEGSGMGLAVVKKVVERFGGQVGVKSVAGEGATFWFTWPKDADRSELPIRRRKGQQCL